MSNDIFKVSYSKVKCWQQCHRQYYYRYILKLRKKIKGFDLRLGEIVHKCIETFLMTGEYDGVISEYQGKVDDLFDEEREDAEQVLIMANSMMGVYSHPFMEEEWEIREVELNFFVDLLPGIQLEVKLDGIAADVEGDEWMLEHKTVKSFPDEKSRMSDMQTVIYKWALVEGGYQEPKGIIWDYLRKKIPTIPQLLKNEEELSKKKIDTTHDVYLAEIKKHKFKRADYKEILESLKGAEENFVRRVKLPISDELMNNTMDDVKSAAIQMRALGHIATDRNGTKIQCSYCDYFDLCQSDLRGLDTKFMIKKSYTTEEQRKESEKKAKGKQSKRRKKK